MAGKDGSEGHGSWTPASFRPILPKPAVRQQQPTQLDQARWSEAEYAFACLQGSSSSGVVLPSANAEASAVFATGPMALWKNVPCADLLALASSSAAQMNVGGGALSGSCISSPFSLTELDPRQLFEDAKQSFQSSCSSTDGVSMTNQNSYVLNLPAGVLLNAVSNNTLSEFCPITPDKGIKMKSRLLSELQDSVPTAPTQDRSGQNNEVATGSSSSLYTAADASLVTEPSPSETNEPSPSETNEPSPSETNEHHNDRFDLNKTPQQKPRRRKHRPRVITEAKPRQRKPVTPKPAVSKDTPTGKRRYSRKKVPTEDSTTSPAKVTGGSVDPVILESSRQPGDKESRDDKSTGGNPSQLGAGIEVMTPNPSGNKTSKRKYIRKKGSNKDSASSQNEPTQESNGSKKSCRRALKLDLEESKDEDISCKSTIDLDSKLQAVQGIEVITENAPSGLHEGESPSTPQPIKTFSRRASPNDSNCSVGTNLIEQGQAQGSKRRFGKAVEHDGINSSNQNGVLYRTLPSCQMELAQFQSICKKKRTEKVQNPTSSLSNAAKDGKLETMLSESASRSNFPASKRSKKQNFESILAISQTENGRKKRSKGHAQLRDLASLNRVAESSMQTAGPASQTRQQTLIPEGPNTCIEALRAGEQRKNLTRKKRTSVRKSPVDPSSSHILYSHHLFSSDALGALTEQAWNKIFSIDSITEKLKHLDINRQSCNIEHQEGNALVPFNTRAHGKSALVVYGTDGTIVPYDGKVKKKDRVKVEVDDETNRVWNLLLRNIDSEGVDGTDEKSRKQWEEERNVFRGRVDSFIARMRLVQGDRRFSPWKGSVVDSVAGVFLTQNVSDHLSSSAFMALAARYPLDPNKRKQCHGEGSSSMVNEAADSNPKKPDGIICNRPSEQETQPTTVTEAEQIQSTSQSAHTEVLTACGPDTPRSGNPPSSSKNKGKRPVAPHQNGKSPVAKGRTSQSGKNRNNKKKASVPDLNEDPSYYKKLEYNAAKRAKSKRVGGDLDFDGDWDTLRRRAEAKAGKKERPADTMDSLDWEAVRTADVEEIAYTIRERGMNNRLADRIQEFLNRLVKDHGSIDLEWLRNVPPDLAKIYLLSYRGLGLKSVECVRLLTLHHLAFPVDTNVGRIAVRLGWVPLQPLPESLQLHLLELYPVLESIQRYLWPRLCKLDQRTLYELHYQMITFGKVFCQKTRPNCNACPMRGDCRHFASEFASTRLALPGLEEKAIVRVEEKRIPANDPPQVVIHQLPLPLPEETEQSKAMPSLNSCQPIIEEPASPELPHASESEIEIEEAVNEDADEEIPTIKLNLEKFNQTLQGYMQNGMELQDADMSKALVALTEEAASIPMPKLKYVNRLRTEHLVYELPDSHPLLEGLDKRETDDPGKYLLAIWTPGETSNSIKPPERACDSQEQGKLCNRKTCGSCNSIRESNSEVVRGTLLIPCRTAMRGSFPLNGTYFQVNEVFADHESSLHPLIVHREQIWNLTRRTVYFGTSVPSIFKGLRTEEIQQCFWRGYICVRGFDQRTRAPKPLTARLHFPASKSKAKGGKAAVNDDE